MGLSKRQAQGVIVRLAAEPPPLEMSEYGWYASEVVLGYEAAGTPRLVTFERDDEEGAPVVVRSACSERWDLTGAIVAWTLVPRWQGERRVQVAQAPSP